MSGAAQRAGAFLQSRKNLFEWLAILITIASLSFLGYLTFKQGEALEKQSDALETQIAAEREASRAAQFATLTVNLGSKQSTVRTAALYGLDDYANAFPEMRQHALQVMAAHLSTAKGKEKAIAANLLGDLSSEGSPSDALAFDLANLDLRQLPLTRLWSSGGYFVGTDFRGADIREARWECVIATHARFEPYGGVQTQLQGATFTSVDVTGANFRHAVMDDRTRFVGAYWQEGDPPRWPVEADAELPTTSVSAAEWEEAC